MAVSKGVVLKLIFLVSRSSLVIISSARSHHFPVDNQYLTVFVCWVFEQEAGSNWLGVFDHHPRLLVEFRRDASEGEYIHS